MFFLQVKVSGGTQTESGYSSRGPAIGSVGKVGPAPSGGIGSNITASGRYLPPDYAEREFADSPLRPGSGEIKRSLSVYCADKTL